MLSVALTAVAYVAAVLWSGWSEVARAIRTIGVTAIVIVLLLSLVNYGLRYVRWQHYLKTLGSGVPSTTSMLIYIAGFSLTTTPAKAGEAVRSVFLHRHGVGYRETLGALLAERISDLIAVVGLSLFGLWIYEPARPFLWPVIGVLVVGLILMQQRKLLVRIRHAVQRRLPEKVANPVAHMLDVILNAARCFHIPIMIYGIVIGLVAWGAEGVGLYVLIKYVGIDVGIATAVFIYSFAILVGAVSLIPGGLGGTEVTMAGLLILHGVPEANAVAITVLLRLGTLWFAVVLGALALVLYQRRTDAS